MFWLWACKPLVAIKFCFRVIVLNLRLAHDQADRDAGSHALQVGSSDEESRFTPAAFQCGRFADPTAPTQLARLGRP
jgi:hypothetical protein